MFDGMRPRQAMESEKESDDGLPYMYRAKLMEKGCAKS